MIRTITTNQPVSPRKVTVREADIFVKEVNTSEIYNQILTLVRKIGQALEQGEEGTARSLSCLLILEAEQLRHEIDTSGERATIVEECTNRYRQTLLSRLEEL